MKQLKVDGDNDNDQARWDDVCVVPNRGEVLKAWEIDLADFVLHEIQTQYVKAKRDNIHSALQALSELVLADEDVGVDDEDDVEGQEGREQQLYGVLSRQRPLPVYHRLDAQAPE
jgi:hypothetical protein